MVLGFAILQSALGFPLNVSTGSATFATDLYMSGTAAIARHACADLTQISDTSPNAPGVDRLL